MRLVLLYHVVTRVLGSCADHGSAVTVLLLVLPQWFLEVVCVSVLVVFFVGRLRRVETDLLPQRLFDDAVGRKLFVGLNEHFSCNAAVFYKLKEGVVFEWHSSFGIVKQDFLP